MSQRVTIVIHSLEGGGAERVAAAMANHWAETGRDVTLITLDSSDRDKYKLDDQVQRVALDVMSESANVVFGVLRNLRRMRRLRRAIVESRPDVVISLVDRTNILVLLATRRLGLDVIVCERTDPRHHDIGRLWSRLRRWIYPRCRALVVQTPGVLQHARSLVRGRPIYVLPNAIFCDANTNEQQVDEQHEWTPTGGTRYLVGLGRLSRAKGFDRAIEAFARIASRHLDWNLRIVGDGSERAALVELIQENGLGDRVELLGWTDRPERVLRQSDLFVLPSRFEGFPNALLEAMACGLPAISFDCESGPAEIVRDGVDGRLVPADDVERLAEVLSELMSDEPRRKQFAARAGEVVERFGRDEFFRRWEAILRGETESHYANGVLHAASEHTTADR